MKFQKTISCILCVLVVVYAATAQEVSGTLSEHAGQQIRLTGFDYDDSFTLGETSLDSLGNFVIPYDRNYGGMGIVTTQDNQTLVLVLDGKNSILLKGGHLSKKDDLQFSRDIQNQQLANISRTFSFNDRAQLAWNYLQKLYQNDQQINGQETRALIEKEIRRIAKENTKLINELPKDSYMSWYAPLRKLVSDMSQSIQHYPERIPTHIQQFRNIDFTHPHIKTSGLFNNLIEGHYFMVENSGPTLDSVFVKMNQSTDYIVNQLQQNDSLLNKISKKLFKLFEKRSLFPASAHLSERLLNSKNCSCSLEEDFQKKLQKYGTLKVGKIAPDVQLTEGLKLSDLNQNVLLVFGSSTCPACQKEALELLKFHDTWKEQKQSLEIVYISLDTHRTAFETAFQNAPWKTYTDLKGWDSQAAKDYYVYATPTYLLLDKNLKVLLHPRSLAHVNAWIPGKLN